MTDSQQGAETWIQDTWERWFRVIQRGHVPRGPMGRTSLYFQDPIAPADDDGEATPSGADGDLVEMDIVVDGDTAGRRADVWLASRFGRTSRSGVVRLFHAGRVFGLDRPLKPSSILKAGERIRFVREALRPKTPPPALPQVLYEDDRLIAFNKPPGMLVHPSGGEFVWALIGLARLARPGIELHLAHRIDRDTSGVVLMAKDDKANRHLKEMFRRRHAEKIYWAFCRGIPDWNTRLVDAPMGSHPCSAIRLKQGLRSDGHAARTRFFVLARFPEHCLVACHPRTGRTHQLRVHLEHLGLPILGDRIYGQPEELFLRILDHGPDEDALRQAGHPRHALHARVLRIPHPEGHPVEIVAPLPEDFRELIRGGGSLVS